MKKIILNTIALFVLYSGFGQSAAEILKYKSPKLAIDSIAEALAELAMDNPEIKMAAAGIQSATYTWKASRLSFLNNLFVAGNLNEFTIKKQDVNNGRSLVYPRYNFGVRLTFGDVFVDPKIAKANFYKIEAETERLKQIKLEVKKEVISAYQDYAMTQKILMFQQEVLQDELIALGKVEERFKNGEISLEAYTQETKTYNNEQVKNVTFMRDLKTKEATLEALLGMPLSDAFRHLSVMLEQNNGINNTTVEPSK